MGVAEAVRRSPWESGLGGAAVVLLLALHLLPGHGGVDPVHGLLSDYQLGSRGVGVPYALALLSACASTALAGASMARRGLLPGWLAKALLAVWCLSLLGLTVFLKDPAGSHGTWYGEAHKIFTAVNFASLPALCALLCWRFRRWPGYGRAVAPLAALHLACALPFAAAFLPDHIGIPGTALGLIERGVVAVDAVLIVTIATRRNPYA